MHINNSIVKLALIGLIISSISCSHEQLKEKSLSPILKSSDTLIIRTNHFQWFLRDSTIWDSATYSLNDDFELISKVKYTIMMLPFTNNTHKSFSIKNIETNEKFLLTKAIGDKKFNDSYSYKLMNKYEEVIAEFKKSNDDDILNHSIIYENKQFSLTSIYDKNKKGFLAQVTDEKTVLALLKKDMNYFSDITELTIERMNNPNPDILFIASSIVVDDLYKDVYGRFK